MFNIYRNGELIAEDVGDKDVRDALMRYADSTGITGPIRRCGGGLLYVGDATQGRYRARYVVPQAEIDAWRAKYPHSPFGTPPVLAQAVEDVGGLG